MSAELVILRIVVLIFSITFLNTKHPLILIHGLTMIFVSLWYFRQSVIVQFLQTSNLIAMSLLIMMFIIFITEKIQKQKGTDVYLNLELTS
ncbi:MAG: hypothetical protein ABH829_02825 [archaeon]